MTALDDNATDMGDLEITGSTGRGREPMSQAFRTPLIEASVPLASITQPDSVPAEQMRVVLESAASMKCDLSRASDE